MNKILDLLKQIGASEQLAKSLVVELNAWKDAERKTVMEDLSRRLDKAKKACVEEVESFKKDLARKVEIFMEARVNTITREAQKQTAIGESEATRTLKGVKSLIEGVQLELPDNQVAVDETKKLRVMVGQLQEEKTVLIQKNKHANTIARKLLEQNRLRESRQGSEKRITESAGEGKGAAKLEDLRSQSEAPKTTRPAIVESVAKSKPTGSQQSGQPEIMAIANGLDGSPALVVTE